MEQLLLSSKVYQDVVQKCQEGFRFYEELTCRFSDLRRELEQVADRLTVEESRLVGAPSSMKAVPSSGRFAIVKRQTM